MTTLLFAAAISTALVAGIFYTFSTIVMRALARITPHDGIAAMQSINAVVINPWFFAAFFGTGLLCIAITVVSLLTASGPLRIAVLVGTGLYLFGCIGVTLAGNVPLNKRLAQARPRDECAASLWLVYIDRWTKCNHVRTAASLAASIALAIALTTG